jgi:hypothetical protein
MRFVAVELRFMQDLWSLGSAWVEQMVCMGSELDPCRPELRSL